MVFVCGGGTFEAGVRVPKFWVLEEELTMPMEANMVEIEAREKEDASTETALEMSQGPSLGHLREILVDIQIIVNNILL